MIQEFLNHTLGNPSVTGSDMQTTWLGLLADLSRLLGLRSKLDVVDRITGLIKESGAPIYVAELQKPLTGVINELLPSSWHQSWKLKRSCNIF